MNWVQDPFLFVGALFHRHRSPALGALRRILDALILASLASAAPASVLGDRLVGSWSLVSRQTVMTDGKPLVDPGLSATPQGILIYDHSGHVAAQLSRPGRTVAMLPQECAKAEKIIGTNDTAQTDGAHGIVTHHLESALFAGDIGKNITRRFQLDGDTLTIQFDTSLADGTKVTRTLLWTRLK